MLGNGLILILRARKSEGCVDRLGVRELGEG